MQKLVDYLMKFFIWLTFALAFLSIFRKDLFIAFIEWMWILIAWLWNWNYLVVFMSGMIESFPVIGVVIPGQNILLLSGWFFSWEGYLQLIMVILAASVWAIIWNYIGYILWVKYWKTFFEKYGLRLWIWETEVTYLEKWVKKWWALWIILWKFQPTTRAFLPFIAWSMWMKSNKFMIYNILWSFLRASTIVCIWLFFVKNYELIIKYMEFIFLAIFAAIWIYIYLYRKEEFKKYWKMKNDEIERKMNKSSVK
jgi:membrane protein DedA with SNARE-associated domain